MISPKGRTNASWISSQKHRDNWDRIFGGAPRTAGEEPLIGGTCHAAEEGEEERRPEHQEAGVGGLSGEAGTRDRAPGGGSPASQDTQGREEVQEETEVIEDQNRVLRVADVLVGDLLFEFDGVPDRGHYEYGRYCLMCDGAHVVYARSHDGLEVEDGNGNFVIVAEDDLPRAYVYRVPFETISFSSSFHLGVDYVPQLYPSDLVDCILAAQGRHRRQKNKGER